MDRSIFVLRNGPVGWAVAASGWRRVRGGGVEIELVEKPCAAGRLSCGPTSAADFCTYASASRSIRQDTMAKHCYRLEFVLHAVKRCSIGSTCDNLCAVCTPYETYRGRRCELAVCKDTSKNQGIGSTARYGLYIFNGDEEGDAKSPQSPDLSADPRSCASGFISGIWAFD